ncbi:MAG: hypothetical protein LBN02_03880 [Oscillospiraceae bacterium]|jgi:hypothetical protein|nr:hypothetical protein [Oscillospiraceae bacterium]
MNSVVVLESLGEGLAERVFESAMSALGAYAPEVVIPDSDYCGNPITCSVALVSPFYKGSVPLNCRVLVTPNGASNARSLSTASEIVTYGMGSRATLSFSSLGDARSMVEVRRSITTLSGERVEQCEYPVATPLDRDPVSVLAEQAVLLTLGAITV